MYIPVIIAVFCRSNLGLNIALRIRIKRLQELIVVGIRLSYWRTLALKRGQTAIFITNLIARSEQIIIVVCIMNYFITKSEFEKFRKNKDRFHEDLKS